MILRGGRLTHADQMGLEEFHTLLKSGIEIMLLSKGTSKFFVLRTIVVLAEV